MSCGDCAIIENCSLNAERRRQAPGEGSLSVSIPCAVLPVVVITALIVTVVALFVGKYNCPDQYTPLVPSNNHVSSCSDDWIGYQRKCYFISTAEENWTSAQNECAQHGATLAVFHSEKNKNMSLSESFLQRYVGAEKHWIILIIQSPEAGHTGKWSNSKEQMGFQLTGSASCTFLNSTGINHIDCEEKLPWICSKPSS